MAKKASCAFNVSQTHWCRPYHATAHGTSLIISSFSFIQPAVCWMKENELMMSDVPWAVAWYGRHQCVWLTLNAQDDFFAINDYLKPVQALYLTPETMDGKFVSDLVRSGEHSWGSFITLGVLQNQIPQGFPLRNSPTGFLPERLFLTDRERWKTAP